MYTLVVSCEDGWGFVSAYNLRDVLSYVHLLRPDVRWVVVGNSGPIARSALV